MDSKRNIFVKLAGNRLVFVGFGWAVSFLVTFCVLPQSFGSLSETATMAAAAFLMLFFGPYLLVVGLCDGFVGDVVWGLAAMVPFVVAQVAFLWCLSSKTSLWRRLGRFGQWARRIAVAAFAILSVVGVWSSLPRVETHKIVIGGDKVKGEHLRFVVISDLHSCYYGNGQHTLVEAVALQRPDAVLLAGDIADDRLADGNAQVLIEQLARRFPCFYVTGNHEYWSERVDVIKAWIRSAGATVLEGDVRTIVIKGTPVDFCGVDDPTYILNEWFGQLKSAQEKSNPSHLRILLSHRPECAEIYASCDFDLVVAGHLHGGQLRLPWLDVGLYGPAWGYRQFFPEYSDGV